MNDELRRLQAELDFVADRVEALINLELARWRFENLPDGAADATRRSYERVYRRAADVVAAGYGAASRGAATTGRTVEIIMAEHFEYAQAMRRARYEWERSGVEWVAKFDARCAGDDPSDPQVVEVWRRRMFPDHLREGSGS